MSWPSNTTLPPVGSSSRVTSRPVVVLPQPDSPTRPSVSPLRTSKLTRRPPGPRRPGAGAALGHREVLLAGPRHARAAGSSSARSVGRRARGCCSASARSRHAIVGISSSQMIRRCSRGQVAARPGGRARLRAARAPRSRPARRCGRRSGSAGGTAQPDGTLIREGGVPLIGSSRSVALPVQARHRAQQTPGVGVLGPVEDVLGAVPYSTHLPPYITRMSSDSSATTPRSWVIDDQRGVELALQVAHQVEDLRLHGDVQRGGRLVGDQQLGVAGQRHGDHRALAHAAGELVRVVVDPRSRLRDARPGRACRSRACGRPPC